VLPFRRMTPGSVGFRVLEWYGLHGRHPGHWRVHAALRNLLKPRFDADQTVTRQGLVWVLDPSDFPQENLFWLGESDRWELLHARRMLRPGAVIFDVGANFGYYALMLAAGLRKACEVHAFEPTEGTYRRLCRHIALNGMDCIHAHRIALSDRSGTASMHGRDGNSGAAFLEPGEGEVQVTTLDAFVAERGIDRLDLIKIDVEGFEEKVLRGGERVLRELRPRILFELQPVTLERAGSSVERLATLLTSHGYRLLQADRDRLVPLVLKDDPGYLVNGFAVPA
jgi:FkbM family methyltransferase